MSDRLLRFHAVFCVTAGGPAGVTRGALSRRFRAKAARLDRAGLTALLDALVGEGLLEREKAGRSERFRPAAPARAFLAVCGDLRESGVRYAASEVAAVLAFLLGDPGGESVTDAVRALAPDTATGLVTMAALRRRTGLDRDTLHAAVRTAFETGELRLHPIAARHQASADEMADGIHTPGGQVLFYVEPA